VTHDFDNDGYLDVLGGGALMVNNGDMTFTQTLIDPNNGPIGDLNNDGFLDIQNGGTIWMNNANANNWLKVHTTGTLSNGNGIGARVEIYSAMGTQIRDVRSGDGFRYMSSLNTHFGIGTDTAIDSVIVRWPSGLVSIVDAPPINGTLDVVEDLSTGVATIAATELSLFPNPAINTLQLRSGQDLSTRTVIVNDLAGKEVLRTTVQGGSIQVDDLKSGMYLLRVMGDDRTIQGRFIKQ
jgi:hypothetical protein